MTISARDVASEVRRRLPGVGDVKLHKLLYYAQGHHLATFARPLFRDSIAAWDLGPVVTGYWREERDASNGSGAARDLDESQLNTVGYVIARYGGLTSQDLVRLSHTETPWLQADRRRTPGTSARIPTDSIREYFAAQAGDDDEIVALLEPTELSAMLSGAGERLARPAAADSPADLLTRRAALTR